MAKPYKIILASGSPRRQQFFKDFDIENQFDFEIRLKEIEEVYPENLIAEEITNYLAELKANAFDGEFESGTLEMSNVDLSNEFTQLITTQRGFQANSRIISTSDELLQELVNLKR
jgi:flagellar basal body rod protein FlgG